jgi:hypothetical protein
MSLDQPETAMRDVNQPTAKTTLSLKSVAIFACGRGGSGAHV